MDRVCAVIVTYNRKELLRECLQAVLSQTRPPDHVLVVDNASTDGTREMLKEEFPQVEVLALPENQGGAGGFHEGMKKAYKEGYDWIWVMDDDTIPERDALERLLGVKGDAQVLIPIQVAADGYKYGVGLWRRGRYQGIDPGKFLQPTFPVDAFAFVGPLIHREVVQRVGLPRPEFFIWFDDVEYALRIKEKGFSALCVPSAKVRHDFGQAREVFFLGKKLRRSLYPAWKLYYGMRNYGWAALRCSCLGSYPDRLLGYLVVLTLGCVGDVLFEVDRWARLKYRLLGVWDAFWGRLGKRFP